MPYIGNQHNVGDHVNNFKVLDDISSHTATFDGSASSVISIADDTIRIPEHRFIQGQRVTYTNGSGGNIGGLTTGTAYFISFDTANTIKLATTLANANSNTVINLSSVGSGTSHTLNAAFDGVNTKFKVTYSNGKAARFNNATQLNVAINNVIQRPNIHSSTFTEGFAIEDNHKIVFKTAPTVNDVFWGSIIANTIENFDLQDNEVDNFTGDGSTTEFTLSTIPANNESVVVSINGVVQHPSDKNTARSYTLIDSIIQFTAAPALGDGIQVRHIGFAGASTADVSGFYGRTGNVALTSSDHITTGDITSRNINSSGIITATTFSGGFSGNVVGTSATFTGNLSVGGVLTYEDVTNVDSVGIITAQKDIHVGAGVSAVGVGTFGSLDISGDIDVDGHTNLDNVSIAGITTMGQTTIFTTGGTTLLLKDSDSSNPADRSGIAFVDQNSTQTAFIGKTSASDAVLTINNTNTINPIRLKVNNTTRLEVGNAGVYATGSLSATGTLSAGGILYIPDEIQHSGDADTKIRFPAADTFSVETGGTQGVRLTSAQKLLVGDHTVSRSVGYSEHIIQTEGSGAGENGISIYATNSSAHAGHFTFGKSRNNSSVADNDYLGHILWAAHDGTDVDNFAARITGRIDGTVSSNVTPGSLEFYTVSAGSNSLGGTPRLVIDSSGHIVPGVDSTFDLGLTGTRFRNVYADTLYGSGANITGIVNASISASAAIAGSKIDPNFGTQTLRAGLGYFTNHLNTTGNFALTGGNTQINFNRASHTPTYSLRLTGGSNPTMNFRIQDSTNSEDRFIIRHGGQIEIPGDVGIGHPVNYSTTNISKVGSQTTLHIKGPSGQGAAIRLQDNGDTADSDDFAIYKNSTAAYLKSFGGDPIIVHQSGSERLRIDANGNTLIGGIRTSNTGFGNKVLISGGTLGLDGNGSNIGMHFHRNSGDTEGYIGIGPWAVTGGTDDDFGIASKGDLLFGTSTSSWAQKMRIAQNGRVKIGTGAPKATLDIKQAGNSWEDALLIQHDNANTGWNIHAERNNSALWFGYNSNTNAALTDQSASQVLHLHSNRTTSLVTSNNSYELTIGGMGSGSSGGPTLWLRDSGTSGSPRIMFGSSGGALDGAFVYNISSNYMAFYTNGTEHIRIDTSGHFHPVTDATRDLGTSSLRWRNVYTTDLQLSNENTGGNEIDGTEGNWTLQEGESDIYMINRKTGKKYKMMLQEVD